MSEYGAMTVSEAGKRGGARVKAKYGTPFYQKIGQMGGMQVSRDRGPEFFSEIGKKGGALLKAQRGQGYYETIGAMGGNTVKARYGRDYYAALGRIGGKAQHDRAVRSRDDHEQPILRQRKRGAKLTLEIARAIRAEYAAGGVTQQQVAERYGVTQGMVGRIVNNWAWREAA